MNYFIINNQYFKFMRKILFLSILLPAAMALLPSGAAYSQEALNVYLTDGAAPKNFALDKIQRITFSGNNLNVRLFDNTTTAYSLDGIAKLRFGGLNTSNSIVVPEPADVTVYFRSPGEITVKSPSAIRRLAVYAIDGRLMHSAAIDMANASVLQTAVDVSAFPRGVYIVQIETQQGTVSKKIIKQ